MEDLNMLAADCVVISCCCQCLILQILVFALLKLPYKLIKKTREFAKRKLNRRRRGERATRRRSEMESYREIIEEIVRINEGECSFRVEAERERGFVQDAGDSCEGCMMEVERVMMEFYEKGDFAFGSFWGRETIDDEDEDEDEDDDDDDFVRYQMIKMFGSLSSI